MLFMNIRKAGIYTLIGLESLLSPATVKSEEPVRFSSEYLLGGKPFTVEWQKKDKVYDPQEEQETNKRDTLCILAGVSGAFTALGAVGYAYKGTDSAAWMMVVGGLVALPTAIGCVAYVSD